MTDTARPDDHVDIVSELTAENVEIDEEVIELDSHTWAIHGRIAYDGEVIAATFETESEAWAALSHPERAHEHDTD
jgi:hypothetical protein